MRARFVESYDLKPPTPPTPVESNVRVATTAEWNAQPNLIAEKNIVYVYSDCKTVDGAGVIPAFKVGNGVSYLRDLPFSYEAEAPVAMQTKTTAEWDADENFVGEAGVVYVYADRNIVDGKNVPGYKIGDGTTKLKDLSYIDNASFVTQEERDSWNNKVTALIDSENPQNLVFSFN